jgi:pimeloyl-ACP methyl ester carboxylesterase
MQSRKIKVAGHDVEIAEAGKGAPLLYLHGFADLHAASPGTLAFHDALAKSFRLLAPAHPCCAGSEEDDGIETIDDLAFRYAETMDALGLDRVDLVGTCIGGWIAAELAVRYPERINRLALIGASGLFVSGHPIGDMFWEAQPREGTDFSGMRRLLFANAGGSEANALFPDDRSAAQELNRYKTMRFASRIGFNPPYFYDPKLRQRLYRYGGPALLLWGEEDRMVPRAHAEAYKDGFPKAKLRFIAKAGHSPQVEQPAKTAAALRAFFERAAPSKAAARRKAAAPKKRKAAASKKVAAKRPAKKAAKKKRGRR